MSRSDEIDKSDMRSIVSHFPHLLAVSKLDDRIVSYFKELSLEGIEGICFIGMGGSSIVGRYATSVLSNTVQLPLFDVSSRTLPAFIGERFATVAISYSGNTEETLSAHRAALERGCLTVTVTSGGMLSKEISNQLIRLPRGYPPRGAFPIMLSLLLPVAEMLCGQPITDFNLLKEELSRLSDSWPENLRPARIAEMMRKRIPVFFGSEHLYTVAYRAKCQINENAKTEAFAAPLPEASHNEIEGYTQGRSGIFAPFFLRSERESRSTRRRIEAMEEILSDLGYNCIEIITRAETAIGEMMDLTYCLDSTSVELADLLGVDSRAVPNISRLKAMLK